jgi:hypothetical protein
MFDKLIFFYINYVTYGVTYSSEKFFAELFEFIRDVMGK